MAARTPVEWRWCGPWLCAPCAGTVVAVYVTMCWRWGVSKAVETPFTPTHLLASENRGRVPSVDRVFPAWHPREEAAQAGGARHG